MRQWVCVDCSAPITRNSMSGRCRGCARRGRGKIKMHIPGDCLDCGKKLNFRNQSGYCAPCNTSRQNADPDFNRLRQAGIERKWQDPEYYAKMQKIACRVGQISALDDELRERRSQHGKWAYKTFLSRPDIVAKSMAGRKANGPKISAMRMAWCPEEMRDRYRFLMRTKRMHMADAREIVMREWADRQSLKHVDSALDYLRRFAPIQRLENGYRVGFSDILSPSEVVRRAELRGWEPERWAA